MSTIPVTVEPNPGGFHWGYWAVYAHYPSGKVLQGTFEAEAHAYEYAKQREIELNFPNGDTPILLSRAAQYAQVAYSTLAQAAREGRILSWRIGADWFTTQRAIDQAIQDGALRPRST